MAAYIIVDGEVTDSEKMDIWRRGRGTWRGPGCEGTPAMDTPSIGLVEISFYGAG